MEAKEMSELLKVLKNEDPGTFLIPCVLKNTKIESVVLDVEDTNSIISLTMYQKLKIEQLKPTRTMVRLADISRAYPVGIAEGVFVKVNDLILQTDFLVLNVGNSQTRLARPFLETARDQIDCDAGAPTCQVCEETLAFDLLKVVEQPPYLEMVDVGQSTEQNEEITLPQGMTQDPLGQEATDWTLANNDNTNPSEGQYHSSSEETVTPGDLQRKLDMIKKVLSLVIVRLNSFCQRESPVCALAKASDTMVVQKKRPKLLPQKFQGKWETYKGHQTFIWEPGWKIPSA